MTDVSGPLSVDPSVFTGVELGLAILDPLDPPVKSMALNTTVIFSLATYDGSL